MQTGCFTEAAFGFVDVSTGMTIFNGTDEAVLIKSSMSYNTVLPWPQSGSLLSASSTGDGSYLHLYKNALAKLTTQRDSLGQITSKTLAGSPDTTLAYANGSLVLANIQTMAFSSNGSWLVTETKQGSFVRINLATLDVMQFASSFWYSNSYTVLESQVAVSDNGQFVAIYNRASSTLKVYDLSKCSGSPSRCESYDYWPFVKQQSGGAEYLRRIRFSNEHMLNMELSSVGTTNFDGTYLLSPTAGIDNLTDYLALGDSYTSGEGAFNYLAGTDTPTNHCHTSAASYPLLISRQVFSASSGHNVACSGARITDLNNSNDSYHGQVEDGMAYKDLVAQQAARLATIIANYSPGYLAQYRFVEKYSPKIITVSAGGNDIGFGEIVKQCVMPNANPEKNTCFNTHEDRQEILGLIKRTSSKWKSLFRRLKTASPTSQIYSVGYPSIVSNTGNCGLNVHLDQEEREFTNLLLGELNKAIAKTADEEKIQYIDISQALFGYRLCENQSHNVAINGLTAGTDAGLKGLNFLGQESYHPNALGHELIAQAILRATNNLKTEPITSAKPASEASFLEKPKSNRTIRNFRLATVTSPDVIRRGKAFYIKVNGSDYGLVANQVYSAGLSGQNQPLGQMTTDTNADLLGNLTLPEDIPIGGQTIEISGFNQAGETVAIAQPIYVTDDSKGRNQDTSCSFVSGGQQDYDQDGIDDACDPLITAPNNNSGSSSNSSHQPNTTVPDIGNQVTTPTSTDTPPEAFLKKVMTPSTKTKSLRYTGNDTKPQKQPEVLGVQDLAKNFHIYKEGVFAIPLALVTVACAAYMLVRKLSSTQLLPGF